MNTYTHLLCLLVLLWMGTELEAQRKVLGKPKAFNRPVHQEGYAKSANIKDKEKSPWIVICDRDGAITYDRINDNDKLAIEKERLKFREWFYVSEERDCCVRIFKGEVNSATLKIENNFKDYGWIDKNHILLWTSSLTDEVTKIDLKAFLLNKASDVEKILELEDREVVKVYNGPETFRTIKTEKIYDFYFVFKVAGDKYLLARNANINPAHNAEDLVGWIRQERLEEWNTRICMEPNFVEDAFLERKYNSHFQLVAYADETSAKLHSETGKGDNSKAIWKSDPAILAPDQLASDQRRFKGGVIRFPMLSEGTDIDYFRTGMIGKIHVKDEQPIPETDWSSITKLIAEKEENIRDNFDVLFLIEGSKSMANYKQSIKAAIKKVSQELSDVENVRYSVAVYRDTPEKAENELFNIKKIHNSIAPVMDFVNDIEFARWYDNDNYTAMYYGINQAILEANLNKQHTNILFVFGNNADLKSSQERKDVDECFLKTDVVAARLAEFNAHIVALQCQKMGREGTFFVKNIRSLMLESANVQFKEYSSLSKEVSDVDIQNPELSDDNQLKHGATIGLIISPENQQSLVEKDIASTTGEAAKNIYDFVETFWRGFNKLVENGGKVEDIGYDSSMGAEDFIPTAARVLFNVVEEGKKNGINNDKLDKVIREKYKLYTEVFIPKTIRGATFDTYSQVLLMPEKDLESYIDMLDVLTINLMETDDRLRRGLHTSLKLLVEQYTGHTVVPRDYGTDDLRAVMQGVKKEGIKSNEDRDFAINHVLNEKKMSSQRVRDFAEEMVTKAKQLRAIRQQGSEYEFSYTSQDNTYFWIPIEYTF